MTTLNFKLKVLDLFKTIGYFKSLEILDETTNTIKFKLVINSSCFVQIYANTKKHLKNYAVILNGQRIYGVDCKGGKWHEHPFEEFSEHRICKEMSLEKFLIDVYEKLENKNLL